MMLALLVYCYANGIFSSRRIERTTYRDIAVRYDRAKALRAQLDADIAALMARAEAADREEAGDPQALPDDLARRQALRKRATNPLFRRRC